MLGMLTGLTNTDAFQSAPFHRGGHDVADQI